MQQWHAATTTRHSYTLAYQFLIWSLDVWLGLELLRDIQFGLPASLNNSLASYQSVATIITCTCVMNALTWREVGVATQKFSGALRAPPFLNFLIRHYYNSIHLRCANMNNIKSTWWHHRDVIIEYTCIPNLFTCSMSESCLLVAT